MLKFPEGYYSVEEIKEQFKESQFSHSASYRLSTIKGEFLSAMGHEVAREVQHVIVHRADPPGPKVVPWYYNKQVAWMSVSGYRAVLELFPEVEFTDVLGLHRALEQVLAHFFVDEGDALALRSIVFGRRYGLIM